MTFFPKNILITSLIFLFLGLCTRFYSLDEPNQIVFDEHHFFGFITDYESGEYFFDIHPPLGKLALWANGQLFGLDDFIDHLDSQKIKKEGIEQEMLETKNKVNALRAIEGDNTIEIQNLTEHYNGLKEESKSINQTQRSDYSIGSEYDERLNTWGLRSLPALFGALLVPLMLLFSFVLTRNIPASILVGCFTLFSPAFLVESQYVLMDSMLMFFIVLGAFFGILYWKDSASKSSWKWWIGASIASALAVSIKWTGLSVVGFSGMILFATSIKLIYTQQNIWWREILDFLLKAVFYWGVIILTYVMCFYAHFILLEKSGEGDDFHTPGFLKTIEGTDFSEKKDINAKTFWVNPKGTLIIPDMKEIGTYNEDAQWYDRTDWNTSVLYGKFAELNIQMGARSAGIRDDHPFDSTAEDWIYGESAKEKGAIYLWTQTVSPEEYNTSPKGILQSLWLKTASLFLDDPLITVDESTNERIELEEKYIQQLHLFPNSSLWTLSFYGFFIGIIIFLFFLGEYIFRYFSKNKTDNKEEGSESFFSKSSLFAMSSVFIGIMILANLLPFMGIERPKFLYHAFEAALFAYLFLGIVFAQISLLPYGKYIQKGMLLACIFILIIYFFWHSPVIYGFGFPDAWGKSLFIWW